MAYLTREDGERFVIPSYRDIITAKSASNLRKEINLLSKNYGEYITFQRKSPIQYEIAFSPDTGYLLGESIWHYFKRPLDMIYCEAIPNTTEAILVIVKDSSVYLDGRFPIDSIPEELVIFLTQQVNFSIYLYGNVPISQTAEAGKFNFAPNTIKSFTVLESPVFPILPLLKIYQLQPVDKVLKENGIGVVPTKKIVIGVIIIALLWFMWTYMTAQKEAVRQIIIRQVNPYQTYYDLMTSPAPDEEINNLIEQLNVFFTMPGWTLKQIEYNDQELVASVQSEGSNIQTLTNWAIQNKMTVDMNTKGITLSKNIKLPNRPIPNNIYPIKQVVTLFIDNLALVYPGNRLKFSGFANKGAYKSATITIAIDKLSPTAIALIANECKDLPMVLKNVSLQHDKGLFTGTISIDALGS